MLIIHAADIHLDSPLAGLTAKAGERANELVGATRRAFAALVDYAIASKVDLVLISGDLFDGDWKDFSTGLFFVTAMAKLEQAGIQVGIIKGNHDAESLMTRSLTWPKNVKVFDARKPETWTLEELGIAVHGQSFPRREVNENIALAYPDPVPGYLNIGMLHTAADGNMGHARYAPCSVAELVAKGYDYWALGHVHNRVVLNERPWVVFPGNLQGRHANETGAKGITLLTVEDREIVGVEHVPLDVVRWARIEVDLTGCSNRDDAWSRILDQMTATLADAEGRTVSARLIITGRTALHGMLAGDLEQTNAECAGLAEQCGGDLWLERVVVKTTELVEAPAVDGDALAELLRTVDEIHSDSEEMEQLRAELEQALTRMPMKVRELGGIKTLDDDTLNSVLEGAAAALRHRIASPRDGISDAD